MTVTYVKKNEKKKKTPTLFACSFTMHETYVSFSWKLKVSSNTLSIATLWRINGNPEQRECDCNETRPHINDGGCLASPPHQPFCERVEMSKHPKTEECSSDELAPLWVCTVNGSGKRHDNADDVHHSNHNGWNHQGAPLHYVQICVYVFVVIS